VDVDQTEVLFYSAKTVPDLEKEVSGRLLVMADMIGDHALDLILTAVERLTSDEIENEWPVKLPHFEVCHPDQVQRIACMNAHGDLQAVHNNCYIFHADLDRP
jgi:predicted amidohydrolase YtcJ